MEMSIFAKIFEVAVDENEILIKLILSM